MLSELQLQLNRIQVKTDTWAKEKEAVWERFRGARSELLSCSDSLNTTKAGAMSNAPTDDDARNAHLFMCLENATTLWAPIHRALTFLPVTVSPGGGTWGGVQEALPFAGNPEPVIRAIRDTGYYVYGSELPHGISQ